MLITQISLEAGYPAASIQERLYCYRDPKDPKRSRGGCVLIAESSCERMNQDLDRSLVVPTVSDSSVAALGDWLRL